MLGLGMVMPTILIILSLAVMPESPRWLLMKGRREEALKVKTGRKKNGLYLCSPFTQADAALVFPNYHDHLIHHQVLRRTYPEGENLEQVADEICHALQVYSYSLSLIGVPLPSFLPFSQSFLHARTHAHRWMKRWTEGVAGKPLCVHLQ